MSPEKISQRVVGDRLDWIDRMIREIQALPFDNYNTFIQDKRNIWSVESCLRRAIESLMDLGRHILAKGFAHGVSEYKEIALSLKEMSVINEEESTQFMTLAGYRNRMVHFYHEISEKELFEICSSQLSDILLISEAIKKWINDNPDVLDKTL